MTAAPIIRIVDDDPNIHDALAYVLENEGFIVRHYESAESFLINDRPEDPGCAILDVRMGEMSGIVLHDRMKARFKAALHFSFSAWRRRHGGGCH